MKLTVAQFAPLACLFVFSFIWCCFVVMMCSLWWSAKRSCSF
uniref:ATP synthase subunit 8 n=1 Tax=Ruditapes decussatus TaxID=104385 RepID=A0A219LUV5_9BIVA|nr:ATP synthase subunit 8 [Ruditapes decussatus]AJY78597.1 ATP synthase subunit 8 [Ruditapes decussatus]